MALQVTFEKASDTINLPKFKPASSKKAGAKT